MLTFASLLEDVKGNAPARAAMSLLDAALARRTSDEQGAFWRAIDLYYVSRKAPGAEPQATEAGPSPTTQAP
ncbi:hypothetical protein MKK70_14730 [Methylobacterium sp. E-041]|jgi:hypothetical protein|uniref:hypothetical protein n=1 Tax=unclassified Methylobacterium TaxID=2615210 RepID=UPI0011CC8503|nr:MULTISPECIES: hypothetical protein [unclassified Methylobacterium]MCJ2008529.1 hypothetical protein [Methylobacterium sp. J-092]MCJ2041781.1 hypothetical protein [Methylobacterium sp. J-059]MCJ2074521.1 hypothetical protein [Methylobacterium sp. E-016]MCJ2106612.1 hypothetical protein [Methylobacterium sp. E-041]TXM94855.1 hypothetical protein FV223_02980 [Methylobacterium sp. WL116]